MTRSPEELLAELEKGANNKKLLEEVMQLLRELINKKPPST